MSYKWLVMCLVSACAAGARAQPVECSEDAQCPDRYYCETDLHANHCRECLHCEDLKREPPRVLTSCIKSVAECGDCIKGYVDDRRGEGNAGCVLPDAGRGEENEGPALPPYMWAVIVISLLLIALVVAVLFYIMRNTDTLKILASASTSVQSPCLSNGAASAPQPPPPYYEQYAPVRPSSPTPEPATPGQESLWPLVKRAPAPLPGDAREAAGNQAAQVFNNPAYVRGPQLPPRDNTSPLSDESENETGFVVHDEDTMESVWTPGATANGNDESANSNSVVARSGANEAAATGDARLRRASRSELEPLAKVPRQDTNNNRSRENGFGEGSGAFPRPSSPPSAPSLVINVLNVNTVQQLNDLK